MKKLFYIIVAFFILSFFLSVSCTNSSDHSKPIRIAISKAIPEKNYQHYIKWVKSADPSVETIDMYGLGIDSALAVLKTCHGLLITGGEDVNPDLYYKAIDTNRCDLPDNYRDSLEMTLIGTALKLEQPIMGICRGLQILNVYFGGSLIFDIPLDYDTIIIHRNPGNKPSEHDLTLLPGTLLANITGITEGITNSNHHQGIDELAETLSSIAFTNDGLIESIQLTDFRSHPFLLGVQWHPERMELSNPLSGKIAQRFVKESKKYKTEYQNE